MCFDPFGSFMCELNSLRLILVLEHPLSFLSIFFVGILSPRFDGSIEHPSLVDFPGAARKLAVLGLKVFWRRQ